MKCTFAYDNYIIVEYKFKTIISMSGDDVKINQICKTCGRDCEVLCQAIQELHVIYEETRTKEKRQLIYRLKKLLGIVDAEPDFGLKRLAGKIIKKIPELQFISECDIKVGYVRSFERKIKDGRELYADCRKVNKVYGAYLPFDFIITFYEPNIGHLSENQLKILMWHELKHIGLSDRGLVIVPHEIEDFLSITDAHSTRWDELGRDVIDILE